MNIIGKTFTIPDKTNIISYNPALVRRSDKLFLWLATTKYAFALSIGTLTDL